MSGKVKMRCARCGRSFRSSGSKQTLCSECAAKERAVRARAKAAATTADHAAPQVAQAPKIVGPGAAILVPGMAAPTTAQPPDAGPFGAAARAEERGRQYRPEEERRPPQPQPQPQPQAQPAPRPEPTLQSAAIPARPPQKRNQQRTRERHEPQRPFELTDELRARIEARYLELSQPIEFDGIRTRIADELAIPKAAVKRAIFELRQRMQLPSWWELKAYKGSEQDLARIRERYEPLLPLPPIGVHKKIAAELELDPMLVYRGIRRIRAELRLPQYNPPESHRDQDAEPLASQSSGG